MSQNFVNYQNAEALMTAIGQKFKQVNGAYVFKGSIPFSQLPSASLLAEFMAGYTFNITNDFTTDDRFVEGSGIPMKAGTNVSVVDLSTYEIVTPTGNENPSQEGWYELVDGKNVLSEDTTVDPNKTYSTKNVLVKLDTVGAFVDVAALENAIQAVSDMITGEFDATASYDAGDVVVHNGVLYMFNADHAAGDWTGSDATATTVGALINAVNAALSSRVDNIDASMADAFDATEAYAEGDVVIYGDTVYKFNAAKTAGAWDSTKVDAVTLASLIEAAEPDALTTAQVNALKALLN